MASLYEIDLSIKELIEGAFNSVDEDGEVQIDFTALEQLKADRAVKLENIALYAKNCASEAAAIKAEIDNLKKRKERLERKSESLAGLLTKSLSENNDSKFETSKCSVYFRSSEVTEILDEAAIPDEYIKVKTETAPDKAAIKKAIKAGVEVAGAVLVKKQNIHID